jgi:copper chaperone CopZ
MSFYRAYRLVVPVLVIVLVASASWAEPVEQKFKLSGVECYEGSRSVQVALSGLEGIDQVRVMVHAKELQVTYDPERTSTEAIIEAVRHARPSGQSANYDATPIE